MKGYVSNFDWLNVEPMKYWSFPASVSTEARKETIKDAIFSLNYIGALKVDGYYQRILKDEDGNIFMIARNKNVNGEIIDKHEWVPHLSDWFKSLPNGTCFLSEIYLPGKEGSKNVTSILGCLKDKAIRRQDLTQKLQLYIFDCMSFDGFNLKDTPYEKRMEVVEKCPFKSPYVTYAKGYQGQELWNKLQEYLSSGREGMVIMRKDALVYTKRTPARVSIKIKKELKETIDVVIIGANPPTKMYGGKELETWQYWENERTSEKLKGEHYREFMDGASITPVTKAYWNGWAGSLMIGIRKDSKIIQVGSLSGITEEVLSNWRDYVGKVAEVSGMEIFSDTTGQGIRHPKFVGWREDLTPADTDWYRWFK